MTSHTHYLWFETRKRQEIIDITDQVTEQVRASGVREGFVLVSAMHISAAVFVNDHESGLWQDILDWLEGDIAPWGPAGYVHNAGTGGDNDGAPLPHRPQSGTGEENAAAHLRSLTIGHEVIVPVPDGRLDLGPWQRIFYGEWDGCVPKRVIPKTIGM